MKLKPLISVVTVVLNDVSNIENTLLSVLSQVDCKFEYIVIDGCSHDGTLDIINKYQDRLKYFVSEIDQGIYHAMNKAIDKAQGEWIFFLNSGDILHSDKTLSKFFSMKLNDSSVLYGQHIIDYGNFFRLSNPKSISQLWKGMVFSHQSVFVLTQLMKKNPFDSKFRLASDYDLMSKLYSAGFKFQFAPQIVSTVSAKGISDKQRLTVISEYYEISKNFFPSKYTKIFFIFKYIDAYLRIFLKKVLPLTLVIKFQKREFFNG